MNYASLTTRELVSVAERDARFNTDPLFTALIERLWRETGLLGWVQSSVNTQQGVRAEHLNTSDTDVRN